MITILPAQVSKVSSTRRPSSTAAASLPNGPALYAYNVKWHTTTNKSPQEIHEIGRAEVKRIRADMDKVMVAAGFKGSYDEFKQFLRTDRRFYFTDAEALLIAYRDIAKRADPELAHLFGTDSRGEVPILAQGKRNNAPITIAGRIDRLVVKPGRVLIVDYKSDAQVPPTTDGIPHAYLSQLGLYALVAGQLFPDHEVEAAILWTSLELLMNLPPAALREAVTGFTIG